MVNGFVHDGACEGLRARLRFRAVEALACPASVVERDSAGALESAGRGDAQQRARSGRPRVPPAPPRPPAPRAAAAASASPRAGRQLGRPCPSRSCRLATVEDVVGDLERDPEVEPENGSSVPPEPSEQAASKSFPVFSEQRSRYVDGRVRVVELAALHRLAAGQAEAGIGEQSDVSDVARRREFGEGPREQVVACGAGRIGAGPPRLPLARDEWRRRRSGRRGRASPCGRARRRPLPRLRASGVRRGRRAEGGAACRRSSERVRPTAAARPPCVS